MSALHTLGVDDDLTGPARSPGGLAASLSAAGHPVDAGLATVTWLALLMHRPLLFEPVGSPVVRLAADAGQRLAEGLAVAFGHELVRITCHPGMGGGDGLPARAVARARRAPAVLLVDAAHRAPQAFLDDLLDRRATPGRTDPVLVLVAGRPLAEPLARRCLVARP